MARRSPPYSLSLDFGAAPAPRAPEPPSLDVPIEPEEPAEPAVLSVAELDRRLKRAVEGVGYAIHVEGEISGLRPASSGHFYFTLKDEAEDAAIDCVMYRSAPPRSRRLLEDGARVVLIGRPTFWAPRGRLQFTAEEARPAGRGALLEALERLKEKLASEGLFDPARKRPLPADPRVIGVVTSAGGAAIHDIVKVAFRRGGVRILLSPAAVQGAGAAGQMIKALGLLERVPEVEVVILGRGGGSSDDLAAFNDEQLARKVAAMRVPVVSAVGHEIDVTLTDLCADVRAATPSQAAEMLVPDAEDRASSLDHLRARLTQALERMLEEAQDDLDRLVGRMGKAEHLIGPRRQEVDEAFARMSAAAVRLIGERKGEIVQIERRLAARHPMALLSAARASFSPLHLRLAGAMRRALADRRRALAHEAGALDALSPLGVLARGYAIATTAEGRAVRSAAEVSAGDTLDLRVHEGHIVTTVVSAVHDEPRSARPRTRPSEGTHG
ncbi:MAG: exodeoxyribonuclease VII large subunit [Byssovorax sp.]